MKINHANPIEIVKEAFWLAYQASSAAGMGFFKAVRGATKDDVWNNVCNNGDYPGVPKKKPGYASGDYVFGRMMKLTLQWDDKSLSYSDSTPNDEYQSWSKTYPTYEALINQAVKNVG